MTVTAGPGGLRHEINAWYLWSLAVVLFGLPASFHGIILACSRQVFALARAGYQPAAPDALLPLQSARSARR